jgi:peroxiredoxin
LEVATLGGTTWRLVDQNPAAFTMVVFYRGYHCPICARYLSDLQGKLPAFQELGVTAIAISSDTEARARQSQQDWELAQLTLGYDLPRKTARAWGLYLSTGRGKTSTGIEEPALFIEPGLFLVRPDGSLYFGSVQTMPFARPGFRDILGAVEFVQKNNYPARGEVPD